MTVMGAFISEVYVILDNNPDSTAGEVFEAYSELYPRTKRSRGDIAKRLTDLMDRGLVAKTGTKICEFSGCAASTWNTIALDGAYDRFKLSNEDAEPNKASVKSCGGCCCGCNGDAEEEGEEEYNDVATMDRDEKARRITELSGEICAAIDQEDLVFLRECLVALGQMDSNSIARLIVTLVPGMKEKAEKLKKALRYFE